MFIADLGGSPGNEPRPCPAIGALGTGCEAEAQAANPRPHESVKTALSRQTPKAIPQAISDLPEGYAP